MVLFLSCFYRMFPLLNCFGCHVERKMWVGDFLTVVCFICLHTLTASHTHVSTLLLLAHRTYPKYILSVYLKKFLLFTSTEAVAILLLLAVALLCAYELCAVYVTTGSRASERYSPSGFFFGVSAIALAINMLFICRMVFNGKPCNFLIMMLVFHSANYQM